MYAFTPSTFYPSLLNIPKQHVTLLDDFFKVVDDTVNESPDRSQKFTELFTTDGVWKTPSGGFQGYEELVESGERWEYGRTLKSIRHWVVEVYGMDAEGKRLMMMGRIEQETREGKVNTYPFSARAEIEQSGGSEPRLKSFQGWSSGF